MSTPLSVILWFTSHVAKQNMTAEAVCPDCGERQCLIKWGFYTRYLFDSDETIKVQRFRCLSRKCPRFTFNRLPHPLLPVLRVPLCFLLALLRMRQKGGTIAEFSRNAGKPWPVIRRCLSMANRVHAFLQYDTQTILGSASPCLQPSAFWTAFTHAFSWAFFPRRF